MLWTLRLGKTVHRGFCRSFSSTSKHPFPRIRSLGDVHSSRPSPEAHPEPSPPSDPISFVERVRRPGAGRQVLFFIFGSALIYGVAAEQTNSNTRYWIERLGQSRAIWAVRAPGNDEIRRARFLELRMKWQKGLDRLQQAISGLPEDIKAMVSYSYTQTADYFLKQREGTRVCYMIGAVNGLVWLAWQLPRLHPIMMRNFTHHPLSGLSYTMITSTFSHSSFMHLLFNTLALSGFGAYAHHYLGQAQQSDSARLPESTANWHFLAFFISAGMFSSVVSHVAATRLTYPRLVSRLMSSKPLTASPFATSAAAAASLETVASVIRPSLGASGAVYAAFTMTAMAFPETQISLIFPPTPPISIQYGMAGMVALDIVGILRGWKMFDHYAHLGGAAFGLWYHAYGPQAWESFRRMTLKASPSPR
ncbi:uncharacterized protein FIBRA_06348 [Fibroporia radiculosa]|uniref:Peptidase S54 rhomboid domain-containing protein n=1 Tax=Fibroporia radiculosa TaxID=599839 RepID=J4IB78_9APHY|nr:uncharacterized protein FIBRA_06348 [Fibroporia radiculosa]CCM04186.1 predicted protein [Fibroporia radiculosa]